MSDELYMRRCIEIANMSLGKTAPNPCVGAVLVYENRIIGEGRHEHYGHAHAEVNAIRSVAPEHQDLIPHSTLYVSLEPCFHYGKTPPCAELVIEKKIKRVVVACEDPFPLVAGKSIEKMKANGIEVVVGVLEKEAQLLARRFFTTVHKKRPYVLLKYAVSADNYMGSEEEQVWLTNPISRRWVHRWRSEEAAILIGTQTALTDNPQLTTRYGFGKNPSRIVLDRQGRLPKDLAIFNGESPTWVITENETVEYPHATKIYLTWDDAFLEHLLSFLYEKRIQSLIVEGGRKILNSFIKAGLWDEARIFQTDHCLGKGIFAPMLTHAILVDTKKILNDELKIFFNKTI